MWGRSLCTDLSQPTDSRLLSNGERQKKKEKTIVSIINNKSTTTFDASLRKDSRKTVFKVRFPSVAVAQDLQQRAHYRSRPVGGQEACDICRMGAVFADPVARLDVNLIKIECNSLTTPNAAVRAE